MSSEHVTLISGAAGGIGEATARAAAARGGVLALADRDADRLRALTTQLEAEGSRVASYQFDVADPASTAWLVCEVERDVGHIGVLVNAAGVIRTADLLEVDPAGWDAEMAVNARGAFFLVQAVARRLVANEIAGSIINVASIAGRSGRAVNCVYAASKAAVISMTRSAAVALAPHGVRVNAVAPGVVDTPMTTSLHQARARLAGLSAEESLAQLAASIPLGRIASPGEVARVILFLASEDAGYVTGQCVNVCGGIEMD